MKTALLLGGYGFLGTNILQYIDAHLLEEYRVIVFDKFPTHLGGVNSRCIYKTYSGDFSDSVLLSSIFEENDIDLVIHSLSTTVPAASFNARYDIETNLLPTLDVLNLMTKKEVYDIIYISSGGAVYGNTQQEKHLESENVFPVSSYGVVKLTIEKYLMQYAELYGLRPLILRLSNPYGLYHYSMRQGICNVALATALKGDKFMVWGDGKARKDYIFVDDFVRILFLLLQKRIHTCVLNVGSGQILSVNQILTQIKTMIPDFEWTYKNASQFDVAHFELDTSALTDIIGNYQFVDIENGLQRTYEWTKNTLI